MNRRALLVPLSDPSLPLTDMFSRVLSDDLFAVDFPVHTTSQDEGLPILLTSR